MKPDPDYAAYLSHWADIYQRMNYDQGLSAFFLGKSHRWAEAAFTEHDYFSRVLEVGAGTGSHLQSVRHRFDEYVMTDAHPEMMAKIANDYAGSGTVRVEKQDARQLNYPDHSFDRLVAAHVLEHLEKPHEVLREWCRVLRPGGVLTLILPCDPGVAWRVGRALGSRPKFVRAGLDYDYWMAREHVNAINNLVAFVRYYFDSVTEIWRPFGIPSMDLNLFYICHIKV